MSELHVSPLGLDLVPPGPGLASLLAEVDLSRCNSSELMKLAEVRSRQESHDQARLLAAMLAATYSYAAYVARAKARVRSLFVAGKPAPDPDPADTGTDDTDPPGVAGLRKLNEFSADQLAFQLTWPRSTVQGHLILAQDLIERLPVVYTALDTGRIDLPRAKAFSLALAPLDTPTAQHIAEREIANAETLTHEQLRGRLHRLALKADPGIARKRYQESVTHRHVHQQLLPCGTAEITARYLPPAQAAAAFNRLDRLARAAKSHGDTRTLPQLRADAMLDLLTGRPFTTTPTHDPHTHHADQAAHNPAHTNRDDDNDSGGGGDNGGDGFEPATPTPPADDWAADERWPHPHEDPGPHPDHPTEPEPGPGSTPDGEPEPLSSPTATGPGNMCVCGRVQPAQRRGIINIDLHLTTLLGLNDDPAHLPGWGPILADIARDIAYDQHTNPAWKYSIHDNNGNLLHHGHITRRPNATEAAFAKTRDRTCIAPGCQQPATTCELDHQHEWANHGPSHRGNLETLCKHHHRLRHEHGHHTHRLPTGHHLWQAPNGTIYGTLPAPNLAFHTGEPGPPPGYVNQYLPDNDPQDSYGRT